MEFNDEFLLGRKAVVLDTQLIQNQIANKSIMITGAAGSIGKAIVKQILNFKPRMVCLIDQSENGIYDLLEEFGCYKEIKIRLADVTDEKDMFAIFKDFQPQIVFHTAAYKHVPILQEQPYQAIKTNVFGTEIIANLSDRFDVEKFIFVSTDKAVNPANVMGITKRLAEVYVQSLNSQSATEFIVTRFGNVLKSAGSVYHTFQNQIADNKPLTVTDPDALRFFMTLFEAAQLLIFAAATGKRGQIFIAKMGSPILILDLAKRMIQLSGKDLQIKYIGLRNGDKPREELLYKEEILIESSFDPIMIANFPTTYHNKIMQIIQAIREAHETATDSELLCLVLKESMDQLMMNTKNILSSVSPL